DRAWDHLPPPQFRARWTGFLIIGQSGWYTFQTSSDDSSKVAIDGLTVVENEGSTRSGGVRLLARAHPIAIDYQQIGGVYRLALAWSRDNGRLSTMPPWALWTTPVSSGRALAARLVDPILSVVLVVSGLLTLWMLKDVDWAARLGAVRIDWALVAIVL